jgi:integrase
MKSIRHHKVKNNGKIRWRVIVPKDLTGDKSKRLFFDDEIKAVKKVEELERNRHRMGAAFHKLDQKSQAKVLIALDKVNGNPDELVKAAEAWGVQLNVGSGELIETLCDECLEVKENAGMSDSYVKTFKCSLKNFRNGIPVVHINEVTSKMIQDWINNSGFQKNTKRGYLTDVKTLFSWCMELHRCARNPTEGIVKPNRETKPPGIHTVDEVQRLLKAALDTDAGLIGYVAPIYFGGLRPVESGKFKKAELHEKLLEVTPEKSKTRKRRFIEINPTLDAWLKVEGVEFSPKNLKRRLLKLREVAKVSWPHDVLRHSFCSYGLPVYGATKIAEWAGHSEQVLFDHYRERVKPDDAKAYWAIRPDNLVHPKAPQSAQAAQ